MVKGKEKCATLLRFLIQIRKDIKTEVEETNTLEPDRQKCKRCVIC